MKSFGPTSKVLGVVGLSLLLAACDGAGDPVPGPEWDMENASYGVHLGEVGSCADVEAAVREAAYLEMKQSLYTEMMFWLEVDEEYCDHDGDMMASDEGSDGGDAAAGSGDPGDSAGGEQGPSDVSETNNQVQGVDEADFIKNDDAFIYMLSGGALHVVKSWPAAETNRVGSIEIEGTPKKLLIEGDLAVVYSSLEATVQPSDPYGDGYYYDPGECTYGYDCQFRGDGRPVKLTVIDLTDRTAPVVQREIRSNGSLLAARRIGDVMHTVLTMGAPSFPIDRNAGVHCDDDDVPDAQDVIDAYTELLLENERIINATPIATVLPSLSDSAQPQGSDALAGCPSFYRGRLGAGAGFTTLMSFDVQSTAPVSSTTVVSDPGAVYASGESLYMAVPQNSDPTYGWYDGYGDVPQLSVVHKFDLGDDGTSGYAASGAVEGRVLNQFSMDEHEGHLRIATTSGQVPDPDVRSTLSVLGQSGSDLQIVGKVENIAPTEDIRSVRFAGDRGFIVTFKKTDPLFVFDLAEPTSPRVLSELKIPGFSTYMHMMDDTHLLTIGYDADDHGDFAYFDGVLLQIFDVSDPLAPALAHKEIIGTRGSSSEALTNHLAFNYFEAKDMLAVPMTICEGGDDGMYGSEMTFSGLMVYDVTVENGFSLRGKLAFADETSVDPYDYGAGSCSNWWSDASSTVKRSVFMDDFVYAVSETRIQVSSLDQVSSPIAGVELPQPATEQP